MRWREITHTSATLRSQGFRLHLIDVYGNRDIDRDICRFDEYTSNDRGLAGNHSISMRLLPRKSRSQDSLAKRVVMHLRRFSTGRYGEVYLSDASTLSNDGPLTMAPDAAVGAVTRHPFPLISAPQHNAARTPHCCPLQYRVVLYRSNRR